MPPQTSRTTSTKTAVPVKKAGKGKATKKVADKPAKKITKAEPKKAGKGKGKAKKDVEKAPRKRAVKTEDDAPKEPKVVKPRVVKAPKEAVKQHLSRAMGIPCSLSKFKTLINTRGINVHLAQDIATLKEQIAEIKEKQKENPECKEVTDLVHDITEEVETPQLDEAGNPVLNDKGKEVKTVETVTRKVSKLEYLNIQKKEKSAEKVRFEFNSILGVGAFIQYMSTEIIQYVIDKTLENDSSMLSSSYLYDPAAEAISTYPFFSNTNAYVKGKELLNKQNDEIEEEKEKKPKKEKGEKKEKKDSDKNNSFKTFIIKIINAIRFANQDDQKYVNLKVKTEFKLLLNEIILELLSHKFSSILRELITTTKDKDGEVTTKTKTITYQTFVTLLKILSIQGRKPDCSAMLNAVHEIYLKGSEYVDGVKQHKEEEKEKKAAEAEQLASTSTLVEQHKPVVAELTEVVTQPAKKKAPAKK